MGQLKYSLLLGLLLITKSLTAKVLAPFKGSKSSCLLMLRSYPEIQRLGLDDEEDAFNLFLEKNAPLNDAATLGVSRGAFQITLGSKEEGYHEYIARIQLKDASSNPLFDAFASDVLKDLTQGKVVRSWALNDKDSTRILKDMRKKLSATEGDWATDDIKETLASPSPKNLSIQGVIRGHNLSIEMKQDMDTRLDHLNPKMRTEVSDLVLGRILLGIPDNHTNNFMVNNGNVISIDHGLLADSNEALKDPLLLPDLQLIDSGFDSNISSSALKKQIEGMVRYSSLAFKERILSLTINDFMFWQKDRPFKYNEQQLKQLEKRLTALQNLIRSHRR